MRVDTAVCIHYIDQWFARGVSVLTHLSRSHVCHTHLLHLCTYASMYPSLYNATYLRSGWTIPYRRGSTASSRIPLSGAVEGTRLPWKTPNRSVNRSANIIEIEVEIEI